MLIIDCFLSGSCILGFPSIGRALWLSEGERGVAERGRLRLWCSQRHARERPWRSRLRPAATGQHLHDLRWRQQFRSAQQEPVVPGPATHQPQQPTRSQHSLYGPVGCAQPPPPSPNQLQIQLLGPFPAPSGSRRPAATRKVLLLVQQQCEHATPLLAVFIGGRLRRQRQLQPIRFSCTQVCLPHQLPNSIVVPPTAAAALWCWGWFAHEHNHPVRRQHHGRIAHLKVSAQGHNNGHLVRRKFLINNSRPNDKNKRDLSCESPPPSRL